MFNLEKDSVLLKNENKQLKAQLEAEKRKYATLETRLVRAEEANKRLNTQNLAFSDMKQTLENELDEKELALSAHQKEKIRHQLRYKEKIANERNKITTEYERRMIIKEKEFKEKQIKDRAKLNALRNIINDDTEEDTENHDHNVRTTSDPNLSSVSHATRSRARRLSSSPKRSIAVANPKAHRRSRSTDAEKWLDHRPKVGGPVPSNTVFQPVLRSRRSVSKLEKEDLTSPTKYALTVGNTDSDGDLVTSIYKGDVIETVGGGRQVNFYDKEELTQKSPGGARKRSYENFKGVGIAGRIAKLEKEGMEGAKTPVRSSKRSKY